MPARLHVFLNDEQQNRLRELKVACGFKGEELSDIEGTYVMVACIEHVTKSKNSQEFPETEPPIPDTTKFFPFLLKETVIKRMWDLSEAMKFEVNDFAFNHIANMGLQFFHEDWKAGKVTDILDVVRKTDQVKPGRYSGGAYQPDWSPHAQTRDAAKE